MRLTAEEKQAIKSSFKKLLPEAEVFLYGSRTDPKKKGGDIDLLVYIDNKVSLELESKIYSSIINQIGEQKIDFYFTSKDSKDSFHLLIKEGSVAL